MTGVGGTSSGMGGARAVVAISVATRNCPPRFADIRTRPLICINGRGEQWRTECAELRIRRLGVRIPSGALDRGRRVLDGVRRLRLFRSSPSLWGAEPPTPPAGGKPPDPHLRWSCSKTNCGCTNCGCIDAVTGEQVILTPIALVRLRDDFRRQILERTAVCSNVTLGYLLSSVARRSPGRGDHAGRPPDDRDFIVPALGDQTLGEPAQLGSRPQYCNGSHRPRVSASPGGLDWTNRTYRRSTVIEWDTRA